MNFQLKIEAYTYALLTLEKLKGLKSFTKEAKRHLKAVEEKIQIAILNHHQAVDNILQCLKDLSNEIPDESLFELIKKIEDPHNFKADTTTRYENPLGRRLESELPILLALNPTKKMMKAVGMVSEILLKTIKRYNAEERSVFLLKVLPQSEHIIAFGAPRVPFTFEELINLLEKNDPKDFIEIMHVHYKFSLRKLRKEAVYGAPVRKPQGAFESIVKELIVEDQNVTVFFSKILPANDIVGEVSRSYTPNVKFLQSPLYTAFPERGRHGLIKKEYTQQMGLFLTTQAEDSADFPVHASSWVADAKSQEANLTSPYVLNLIDNEAIYVAGPSGMTSLLLSQMEMLGNFKYLFLKQHYLTAVVAYLIAGGFHSLHEILGPAEYILKLIPGYAITPPTVSGQNQPPNFYHFYQQQMKLDPEFRAAYNLFWEKYLSYFRNTYLTAHLNHSPNEDACKGINENSLGNEICTLEKEPTVFPGHSYLSLFGVPYHKEESGNIQKLLRLAR